MRAVIYPMQAPSLEAETLTSKGGEKISRKEQKADKMETIESWWEDKYNLDLCKNVPEKQPDIGLLMCIDCFKLF